MVQASFHVLWKYTLPAMPTITEIIISFIFITIDKRVIQLYNRLYDRIKGGYGK